MLQILSGTSKRSPSSSSSITEENGSTRMLCWRIGHPLCKLSGLAHGYGDKDHVNFHEVSVLSSTKLPYTEKLPPYTTWIFLDRYIILSCG